MTLVIVCDKCGRPTADTDNSSMHRQITADTGQLLHFHRSCWQEIEIFLAQSRNKK